MKQMSQLERPEQTEKTEQPGITRVEFSFRGEGAEENIAKFEDILIGGAWGRGFVDYKDELTLLLAGLFVNGGIAVYKRVYPLNREYSPEVKERGRHLRFMMKRQSGVTDEIADLYPYDLA